MLELKAKPLTLLKKAVAPISIMADIATIIYCPGGISLRAIAEDANVMVVLRIDASCLDYFRCNVQGCDGIDPKLLYLTLDSYTGEEWYVTIHGDGEDDNIGFVFQNDIERFSEYHEMKILIDVPEEMLELEDFQHEYQGVVGIPSPEFKRILMHLHFFGPLVYAVDVYITNDQVKLTSTNEEFVLTKENGECIIGGVEEDDDPVEFSFNLQQIESFLNASVLSSTVWIFTPVSPDNPCMINCPVGSLGNLMFYFF